MPEVEVDEALRPDHAHQGAKKKKNENGERTRTIVIPSRDPNAFAPLSAFDYSPKPLIEEMSLQSIEIISVDVGIDFSYARDNEIVLEKCFLEEYVNLTH